MTTREIETFLRKLEDLYNHSTDARVLNLVDAANCDLSALQGRLSELADQQEARGGREGVPPFQPASLEAGTPPYGAPCQRPSISTVTEPLGAPTL